MCDATRDDHYSDEAGLSASGTSCIRNALNLPSLDLPREESSVLARTKLVVRFNQLVGRGRGWGPLKLS